MADPAPNQKPNDGATLAVEPSAIVPTVSPTPAAASADVTAAPASADVSLAPPSEAGAAAVPDATAKPAIILPTDVPTLLEESTLEDKPKAEEAKPAVEAEKKPDAATEAKKPEEQPKAPEEPKAAPLAPIDYFASVKLPDTLKMDDALKGDVTKAFDAFRADPNTGAQSLIDLHNKTMTDFAEETRRNQYSTFNDTRKQWQDQIKADPEMGGAGFETTKRAVARMRDLFVPEKDMKEFNDFLRITGAGDHPAFYRMLHRAARFYDEPKMPPENPKPPPGIGKRPGGRATADLYPNTTFK